MPCIMNLNSTRKLIVLVEFFYDLFILIAKAYRSHYVSSREVVKRSIYSRTPSPSRVSCQCHPHINDSTSIRRMTSRSGGCVNGIGSKSDTALSMKMIFFLVFVERIFHKKITWSKRGIIVCASCLYLPPIAPPIIILLI